SALTHYRKGEIDPAAGDCEVVLRRPEANHFWAQYVGALCNLRQQQWSVAIVRLNACLEKQANAPWLLMHRALAQAGAGKLVAAEADFAQALAGSTAAAFRAEVMTNRSVMWMQQQRWTDAEADLRQAIQLQPQAYQGYVNLAKVYQEQDKRDAA